MRAFWAIVKKELRAVTREKTIMIAIGIQLFIASFSSVVLIGLLSFYDPEAISSSVRAVIRVGVLGESAGPLIDALQTRNIRTSLYPNVEAAEQAFQAGRLDAIVYVPPPYDGVTTMKLVLPNAETRASVILILLKEPLKRFENELRARHGVELRYANLRGLPSTTFEFLYSIIIPVLMFFPAFVAGSLAVDSIAEELESNTLETLRAGPVSIGAILGGKITAALLLALIQCVAWLILLRFNQIGVANAPAVLLLALLVAALNTVISALLATAFRDRERAQFTYSIVIVGAVAVSTALNFSPIQLLTRLAAGSMNEVWISLAGYGVLLLGLLAVFVRAARTLLLAR